ncbi:MAG: ribonuclease III [Candidatus Komeilibacteria bacterium]|nr:ribonuclease III [Candidatus Komeilibacteria bacterium]
MNNHKDLSALYQKLGITFIDPDLLRTALVHRSYLNENKNFPLEHNERLEFLGDAVLELVVTEYLYTHYPNPEGDLTNWRASLVNAKMLSEIAKELTLENFLYLSRGEASDNGSKARGYILANCIEAVIGAIYLDQGLEASRTFIGTHVLTKLPYILTNKLYLDAKSKFQEQAQELYSITPHYQVLDESGPDHAKFFKVGVYLGEELVAFGTGTSKQEAQLNAADAGLKAKGWE